MLWLELPLHNRLTGGSFPLFIHTKDFRNDGQSGLTLLSAIETTRKGNINRA